MVASNDTQTGTASGPPRLVAKQLAGLGHATGGEPGQVPATFVD